MRLSKNDLFRAKAGSLKPLPLSISRLCKEPDADGPSDTIVQLAYGVHFVQRCTLH